MRFYLTGFGLDPTPLDSRNEGKSEGLLRALIAQLAALLRNFSLHRKIVQHSFVNFELIIQPTQLDTLWLVQWKVSRKSTIPLMKAQFLELFLELVSC